AYAQIDQILTTSLWNVSGVIPYTVNVPDNKNFLVLVENNDVTNFTLPDNDKLTIVIDRDLDFRQSMDLVITADDFATENKQIEIFLNYRLGGEQNAPVLTKILGPIDLPVYYNSVTGVANTAKRLKALNFEIDLDKPFQLNGGGILEVPVVGSGNLVNNSFKAGDQIVLDDFVIGTSSGYNFSGQYRIDSVGASNSVIYLDVNGNAELMAYGASGSNIVSGGFPLPFNATQSYDYLLANKPSLELNKGYKWRVTRVDQLFSTSIQDRYLIERITI
ncbi:hypothetical protein EBU71_21280, partial [bacterium]|nr:hypothetical protein [Candidatus Elulimicrobium humile]